MNWKINILTALYIVVFACNSGKNKSAPTVTTQDTIEANSGYANTKHLIEVSELKDLLGSPDFKIIHFGKPAEYSQGHIPGSLNIWRTDIEDTSYPYGGMMASRENLTTLFGLLGIKNSDTLIIYDSAAACESTRLWWVLDNYGFKNTKILNGGIQAWSAANGELTEELPDIRTTLFTLAKEPPMHSKINHDQILRAINSNENMLLLDTRSANEFSGNRQKNGAKTAGRIPGSYLKDWAEAVNYNGDKMFKSHLELQELYSQLAPDKDELIIVYCHTGVRSSHTFFVLQELLGYTNLKNYDGSWTEWSHITSYPKVKDSTTTIFN